MGIEAVARRLALDATDAVTSLGGGDLSAGVVRVLAKDPAALDAVATRVVAGLLDEGAWLLAEKLPGEHPLDLGIRRVDRAEARLRQIARAHQQAGELGRHIREWLLDLAGKAAPILLEKVLPKVLEALIAKAEEAMEGE